MKKRRHRNRQKKQKSIKKRQSRRGPVKSSGKKGTVKKISSTNKDSRNKGKILPHSSPFHTGKWEKTESVVWRMGYYSKTIRFYDINYQLAQNEDKNAIFENWCDFLNYFDSTIHFQLSFINHHSNMTEYEDVIRIKKQNDSFDDLRMEFAQMLRSQFSKRK